MSLNGENQVYSERVVTFERVFDVNKHAGSRGIPPYTHFGYETAGKRCFGWRVPGYPKIYSGMSVRLLYSRKSLPQFNGLVGWLNIDTLETVYTKPTGEWGYLFQQFAFFVLAIFIAIPLLIVAVVSFRQYSLLLSLLSAVACLSSFLLPYFNRRTQKSALEVEAIIESWLGETQASESIMGRVVERNWGN